MTAQDGIGGFHIGTEYAVAYHYDNAGTSGQLGVSKRGRS